MFDKLKSFFGFSKKEPAQPTAAPAAAPAAPVKEEKKSAPAPAAKSAPAPGSKPAPAAAPAPAPAAAAASNIPDENINLPLKAVLARLPASLSALVKTAGNGEIGISLRKVLPQLRQGSVKISFGELRQAAPPGTFLEVASQDQTMVELPLPDILSRINPSHLARMTPSKVLEAPAEVGNIFGERGQQLPQPQEAPSAPKPAASAAPVPIAPSASAPLPAPATPVKPAAPLPAPSLPKPAAAAAPAPVKPSVPLPAPSLPKPVTPSTPLPAPSLPKPPTPTPVAIPKPPAPSPLPAPSLPKPPAPTMPAPSLPKPPAPAPMPSAVPAPAVMGSETLTVTIDQVSADWPDAVKQEVKSLGLGSSSLVLPTSQIEAALKSGKITYPWKQLLSWTKPTPSATSTPNGDVMVDLPLSVMAPLFMAQHKPAKQQKKLAVGENIPDIFSGGQQVRSTPAPAPATPAPAPAPTPVAAPVPVPAMPAPSLPKPPAPMPVSLPKPPAPAPAPAVEKVPATIGEVFGQPAKKDWSPKEIVEATGALKGMAGAVIATNDGLLVAGFLPAPLKPETIGAFLPQIFGRMNQYGKELQVGDMNSLTVEFQKVPWHVVKIGPIFFAAVGKAGEPLPAAHLAVIVGELGKQMK